MGLRVGTIVKPYNSGDSDSTDGNYRFTCDVDVTDVCVGIVTSLVLPFGTVKWVQQCETHKSRIPTQLEHLDDLWQVGQLY